MIKNKVRLIGDVHGDDYSFYGFKQYLNIISDIELSIQIGDFGNRSWSLLKEYNVDGFMHKIIAGNHDNYDYILQNLPDAYLGDFGNFDFCGLKFFHCRGGDSIDKAQRMQSLDWWQDEELTYAKSEKAFDLYIETKPEIVITHVFPDNLLNELFEYIYHKIPSITGQLFNRMFEEHQPKLWIFGHMHPWNNRMIKIGNTQFICLAIRQYVDYDLDLSVDDNIKEIKKQINEQERLKEFIQKKKR